VIPSSVCGKAYTCGAIGIRVQLKALGIDNILKFKWLSPPPAEALVRALESLAALGAVDHDARRVIVIITFFTL
jgi:HrpA-like RNA helicase